MRPAATLVTSGPHPQHARPSARLIAQRRAVAILSAVVLIGAALVSWSTPEATPPTSSQAQRPRWRVALQVGHLQSQKLPAELADLRAQVGGHSSGIDEWRVNLRIATLARRRLISRDIDVDLLPATVPPGYGADAFVSIHSDALLGRASGFRVAASARDRSGTAAELSRQLGRAYQRRTRLPWNAMVGPSMTRYYAFQNNRYRHTVRPTTPSAILETGFLTEAADRRVIVDQPSLPAAGIADGVVAFLRAQPAQSATG